MEPHRPAKSPREADAPKAPEKEAQQETPQSAQPLLKLLARLLARRHLHDSQISVDSRG